MRAGKLRRVIEIQRSTGGLDEFGSPAQVWAKHKTLRAEQVERSTSEFLQAGGAEDAATIVFRTRYLSDISTTDRVAHKGNHYAITEISEIGYREGLELRCAGQEAG